MFSLRVVASIITRFGATVLAATIVGTYLLLGFSAQAPDVQTVVRVADILAMLAAIFSGFGILVGDFITSESGLVRYAVFTLGGAIVGSTFWWFIAPAELWYFGALPGGAAGFVAGLWRPWIR